MKKAISVTTLFTALPLPERFAKARAAGFDWVELGDWTELDLTRVSAELAANRLRLAGISGAERFALTNPEQREGFLEHLSQSIAVAKSLGCTSLVLASREDAKKPYLDKSRRGDFDEMDAAARALGDAAAKAARAGVTLHVKPTSLDGVPALGEVVKALASPALRLLFPLDFGRTDREGLWDSLRAYRAHVDHIHIGGGQETDLAPLAAALREEPAFRGMAVFVAQTGKNIEDDLRKWAAL